MRILTASMLMVLISAAFSGCTDNAGTDSIDGTVDGTLNAAVDAVLAADMDLAATTSLYMTTEAADNPAVPDARLLQEGTPDNLSAEVTAEVLVTGGAGDQCASWVTDAGVEDDLDLSGTSELSIYATAVGDPSSTITMALDTVSEAGTVTNLGTTSIDVAAAGESSVTGIADAAAGADAYAATEQTLTMDLTDQVLAETEFLQLTVCAEGNAAVTIHFGGQDAPSGIPVLPQAILDSDGDGYGDSEERRYDSDPERIESTPNNPDGNAAAPPEEGSNPPGSTLDPPVNGVDPDSAATPTIEPLLAAGIFLLCLAFAGFALLGRFQA